MVSFGEIGVRVGGGLGFTVCAFTAGWLFGVLVLGCWCVLVLLGLVFRLVWVVGLFLVLGGFDCFLGFVFVWCFGVWLLLMCGMGGWMGGLVCWWVFGV